MCVAPELQEISSYKYHYFVAVVQINVIYPYEPKNIKNSCTYIFINKTLSKRELNSRILEVIWRYTTWANHTEKKKKEKHGSSYQSRRTEEFGQLNHIRYLVALAVRELSKR